MTTTSVYANVRAAPSAQRPAALRPRCRHRQVPARSWRCISCIPRNTGCRGQTRPAQVGLLEALVLGRCSAEHGRGLEAFAVLGCQLVGALNERLNADAPVGGLIAVDVLQRSAVQRREADPEN